MDPKQAPSADLVAAVERSLFATMSTDPRKVALAVIESLAVDGWVLVRAEDEDIIGFEVLDRERRP